MQRTILNFILLSMSIFLSAQEIDSVYFKANYDKAEYFIPMRDSVKLYTIVYTPKNKKDKYPILMNRTCYNITGYDNWTVARQPSPTLIEDKYIIVYQDVRGRYMSEGTFDNMRPNIPGNDVKNKTAIDESSDTYDTVDWLIENVENNNGRVGQFGISYPGFYTAAALPDAHPALKASSPQAPISDFFFDDFHHHGTYLQSYTPALSVFGYHKEGNTKDHWFREELGRFFNQQVIDAYDFYLDRGPLKTFTENEHHDNFFWKQIIEHPNYDDFWQERSILPHLKGVKHAVMTVGGWFDAEDLYGPLNIYKTIEETSPKADNIIVMGPWTHGGWAGNQENQTINHIDFGKDISVWYQKNVEAPFFNHHLKCGPKSKLPEALMFDTGTKKWEEFDEWPPKHIPPAVLFFGENGELSVNEPTDATVSFDYLSDPAHPVPYRSELEGLTFTPKMFMTDDQRHASKRPDVITFQTDALEDPITIAGEILASLVVSMSQTDADFIVKLIDVYPVNHPNYEHNPENIQMGGYQQLVRHESFRGRFRDSYEHPKPFEPGVPTNVDVPLQDILHTFKKGHRMMIQIHSTWFPYIDRNPQKYVDNIYEAEASDFTKSTITVYGSSTITAGGDAINNRHPRP